MYISGHFNDFRSVFWIENGYFRTKMDLIFIWSRISFVRILNRFSFPESMNFFKLFDSRTSSAYRRKSKSGSKFFCSLIFSFWFFSRIFLKKKWYKIFDKNAYFCKKKSDFENSFPLLKYEEQISPWILIMYQIFVQILGVIFLKNFENSKFRNKNILNGRKALNFNSKNPPFTLLDAYCQKSSRASYCGKYRAWENVKIVPMALTHL